MTWTTTKRFRDSIPKPHHVVTTCTVTPPGGTPTTLRLAAGSVTADRSQRIRRTSSLDVIGGTSLFAALSDPGARIAVDHGIQWKGTERELIPMIRGELSTAALQLGEGTIRIQVADRWQGLAGADYLTAFSPATTAGRLATIITAVTEVYPGITIRNTASDTGTVATSQAWTSRADMISSLATDGGTEAFFAPDGAFVLRDQPVLAAEADYLIKTGPGGTLATLSRSRPLDKIYNAVILTPGSADLAQTWTQVVVVISDPANPRHPNRIGRTIPLRYQAPSILTQGQAIQVAQQLLAKVQGSSETLSLDALANPALEPGDTVRIVTPLDGGNDIVNHFLDSVQTDLVTGSMTCGTRASDGISA